MTGLLLSALLALPGSCEDPVKVQRYLESLKLGDRLEDVKVIYPPKSQWGRELFGGVERLNIQRGAAKYLPNAVESMKADFKRGRLVRLEVVYAREFSKQKPLERLVADLSLQYGEPRRDGETYFWWDGDTVLAASRVSQPHPSGEGLELRSTLAVMDRSLFPPLR